MARHLKETDNGKGEAILTGEQCKKILDSITCQGGESVREVVMATVPCVCTSKLCGHVAGERCGQPVSVKLKLSVAMGDSRFGQEHQTGICDRCWETVTRHYPELFRNA